MTARPEEGRRFLDCCGGFRAEARSQDEHFSGCADEHRYRSANGTVRERAVSCWRCAKAQTWALDHLCDRCNEQIKRQARERGWAS